MPASNYVRTNTLSAWLQNVSFTRPTVLYVALFTNNPTAANTGTEVSGGGYARAAATFSTPVISGDRAVVQNTAEIDFPQLTASAGTAAYVGIMDARTGGNLLFYEPLPTAMALEEGYTPYFSAGQLKVYLT